jgi:sulfatase-like protein
VSFFKRMRPAGSAVVTALAALLVFFALIVPDQITRLPPGNSVLAALVRIPIEALVATALLLALPARARDRLAALLGLVLGLLTIIKIIDMAFFAVLAREFDPVLDWILFPDGYHFLEDSIGKAGAFGVAAVAVVLIMAVLTFMTLAVRRLSRLLAAHAGTTRHTVFAFSAAWVILAVLGVQIVGGIPIAARSAAELARDTALKVPQDIADQKTFAKEVQVDAFRGLPDDQLLTGLRGNDVILAFVESYGRDAVENPEFNGRVLDQLRADDGKLAAAGFASRSGFLTSSTAGGGSWLAHSTFLSGLQIDNQQRYRSLVNTDRLTLTKSFKRAGYRTVGVEPGVTYAWPEAAFYGYDQVWDSHTLDYHGPAFSWSTMPDQFVMARFQKLEYAKPQRAPLLAEITLTSSHTPWAPVPTTLDWDKLGDGSVYGPMVAAARSPQSLWKDTHQVREEYARSIAYSVDSLVSYVQNYADDNLVMIFLGDHQPASIVVGQNAGHDVPISIIAKDKSVLDRVADWGWTTGLTPAPTAPTWPMSTFRDRFLTAFGPNGDPH